MLKLLSWWLVLGEDKRVADRPGEGNRMVEDTEDTNGGVGGKPLD